MQTTNRFAEYDYNAAFPSDQPGSTKAAPSPAPAGEVSEPAHGGGLRTNTPTLTNALMHDLLDPTVSTLQLCDYHNLNLPQLIAITHSEEFAYFKAAIKHMSTERKDLIDHETRYTAAAALKDIASQRPESDRHAETIRKAAAASRRPIQSRAMMRRTPQPTRHAPAHAPQDVLPPKTPHRRRQQARRLPRINKSLPRHQPSGTLKITNRERESS